MEREETKKGIIKETFLSEMVSTVGSILAGIVLTVLILPFQSFLVLILMIPALLSLRGNISGPFIARTSKDFIIGNFSKKTWSENVLATYTLSVMTSIIIGLVTMLLNISFFHIYILGHELFIIIPILTMLFTLTVSIPCSTLLNFMAFRRGLDPNNVVNPIMTAIDDFITVMSFYIILILLGVP